MLGLDGFQFTGYIFIGDPVGFVRTFGIYRQSIAALGFLIAVAVAGIVDQQIVRTLQILAHYSNCSKYIVPCRIQQQRYFKLYFFSRSFATDLASPTAVLSRVIFW